MSILSRHYKYSWCMKIEVININFEENLLIKLISLIAASQWKHIFIYSHECTYSHKIVHVCTFFKYSNAKISCTILYFTSYILRNFKLTFLRCFSIEYIININLEKYANMRILIESILFKYTRRTHEE